MAVGASALPGCMPKPAASRARPITARTNGTKAGLPPPGVQHAYQLIIGQRGEAASGTPGPRTSSSPPSANPAPAARPVSWPEPGWPHLGHPSRRSSTSSSSGVARSAGSGSGPLSGCGPVEAILIRRDIVLGRRRQRRLEDVILRRRLAACGHRSHLRPGRTYYVLRTLYRIDATLSGTRRATRRLRTCTGRLPTRAGRR
jgi:hypothetical protein